MSQSQRRTGIGLVAGLISSVFLAFGLPYIVLGIGLGLVCGWGYAQICRSVPGKYLDNGLTAAALGVALWALLSVVLIPALVGPGPQWTVAGMQALLPALASWVLYGLVMGVLVQLLSDLADWQYGVIEEAVPAAPERITHILILGGGFAGVTTAQRLEHEFGADRSVSFTLVSDTNGMLFTPMLPEAAASSLEPTHILTPLRTSVRRTRIIRGRVTHIDLEQKKVRVAMPVSSDIDGAGTPADQELTYDQLVLALGAVSNYLGMTNVQTHAFDFKSLRDAIQIREHVIDMFERAERENRPAVRQELVRFVVAGGGFSGAELAGGLNDFARGMLVYYPNIPPEEVQIIVVHSRDFILPELSRSLGDYALKQMTERGITFKLNVRVSDAHADRAVLNNGEEIRNRTLIWTAGTTPSPLVKTLPVERNKRGAVIVDGTMAVPNYPAVWAVGDCAEVPNAYDNQPSPPTAQFAIRQAKTLAYNIYASVRGKPTKPFSFEVLGMLAVVGHQTAAAEVTVPFTGGKQVRFSGLLAWLMWRGVYLSKLPGLDRQVRVLVDWVIELFFPRDIVELVDLQRSAPINQAEEQASGASTSAAKAAEQPKRAASG